MPTLRSAFKGRGGGSGARGKPVALVVGGAGFLGRHVVQQLLDSGRYAAVRVFDIRECGVPGAEMVVGDIRKQGDVDNAVAGADVVVHVATATPTSENALNKALMDDVNVKGTAHVVAACRAHGVRALVYTSSASVVFDGRDLVDVDESAPYTRRPMDYYTETKIEGERLALAANGSGGGSSEGGEGGEGEAGLAVCALRPSGIFGEGDTVMVPTFVRQARRGKMKYIIGPGTNVWDFTYVGNVAQAHVLAADALLAKGLASPAAGEAFFVTNQQPVPFWGFTGDLLEGLGYGRPRVRVPLAVVLLAAMLFEYVIRPLLSPVVTLSTDFTVFRVRIVTTQRAFSCAKARRVLGYVPAVPLDEAIARTVKHFAHLRNDDGGGGKADAKAKAAKGS